ncbi:hypothetical protein JAAARDRAFT_61044 [Jaapia argillacea MUCL 33604]|uniref:Mid2 domain-containing protein n=1 Tax=Jaapia argillacea MUCL 33604 TaxID=933084 RepID=A0A067PGR5_9AGAM|nr:hypothetical protein JAAARDRAFT_61044 [Jaapia argillacea MUCL 33604]
MRCSALFLASLLPLAVYCQLQLQMNPSPYIAECQPVLVSWVGGIRNVWVVDPCPSSCSIAVGSSSNTSWTWIALASSGTKIQFCVSDSSNPFTCNDAVIVQTSANTACLSYASTTVPFPSSSPSDSADIPTPTSPTHHSSSTHHSSIGPIVGGIVGGLVLTVILGILFFLWWRRRSHSLMEQVTISDSHRTVSLDDSPSPSSAAIVSSAFRGMIEIEREDPPVGSRYPSHPISRIASSPSSSGFDGPESSSSTSYPSAMQSFHITNQGEAIGSMSRTENLPVNTTVEPVANAPPPVSQLYVKRQELSRQVLEMQGAVAALHQAHASTSTPQPDNAPVASASGTAVSPAFAPGTEESLRNQITVIQAQVERMNMEMQSLRMSSRQQEMLDEPPPSYDG